MKKIMAKFTSACAMVICFIVIHTGINPLHADVRQATAANGECVVLLHGLARTSFSMRNMASHLNRSGYATANVDYPSTQLPLQASADIAVKTGIEQCRRIGASKIHFVTHSLGGLLVRSYLARNELPELGRVVMLAPPNQGSEAADAMMNNPLYEWLGGPTALQIGTAAKDFGEIHFPAGVIAGNKSLNPLLSRIIPGPDDGKVSVARSRAEGISDFLVLPTTHVFIMKRQAALAQTRYFLEEGQFQRQ